MKNIFCSAIGFLICCNMLVSMEEQKNHILNEIKALDQSTIQERLAKIKNSQLLKKVNENQKRECVNRSIIVSVMLLAMIVSPTIGFLVNKDKPHCHNREYMPPIKQQCTYSKYGNGSHAPQWRLQNRWK